MVDWIAPARMSSPEDGAMTGGAREPQPDGGGDGEAKREGRSQDKHGRSRKRKRRRRRRKKRRKTRRKSSTREGLTNWEEPLQKVEVSAGEGCENRAEEAVALDAGSAPASAAAGPSKDKESEGGSMNGDLPE